MQFIEYIKAIKAEGSKIIPYTIKREGAGYHDSERSDCTLQSATAIRSKIVEKSTSALDFVPKCAKEVYTDRAIL